MDVTCEHCGLVMTEGEAIAGVCPGCRNRLKVTNKGRVNQPGEVGDIRLNLVVD